MKTIIAFLLLVSVSTAQEPSGRPWRPTLQDLMTVEPGGRMTAYQYKLYRMSPEQRAAEMASWHRIWDRQDADEAAIVRRNTRYFEQQAEKKRMAELMAQQRILDQMPDSTLRASGETRRLMGEAWWYQYEADKPEPRKSYSYYNNPQDWSFYKRSGNRYSWGF